VAPALISSPSNDAVSTAVTALPSAANAATNAPASPKATVESVPNASLVQPSESPTPMSVQPKKGVVFSPLPPDLAPTNQGPVSNASSAQTPDANNSMETLDDKHLLAIGDRLSFRIVEDEEEPRSLTVMDSGELEVPHIGRFNAVGKSCKQLAKALKAELEKEYYYQATVVVAVDSMARSRGKVYLVGPVRVPGPQDIPSDETLTLSKAILRAGGFSDFADKRNVKITRKAADGIHEDHITVDVSAILEKGQTASDVPLLPGDLIYVPERLFRL
jgi:protein involved in polysaccharide export with SLBB domain